MVLISNFKDYYDYLTGIYGVDPLVVYDRRPAHWSYGGAPQPSSVYSSTKFLESFHVGDSEVLSFYICGKLHPVLYHKGKLYADPETMKRIVVENRETARELSTKLWNAYGVDREGTNNKRWGRYNKYWLYSRHKDKGLEEKINEKCNSPIVLTYGHDTHINPKLDGLESRRSIPRKRCT